MTKQPWFRSVYQACVDHIGGCRVTVGRNYPPDLSKINLNGWTLVSHVVTEADSFGPVCSLLRMRSPKGVTFRHLI